MMGTFLGMATRNLISCTYQSWNDVPNDLLDRLWEEILTVCNGVEDRRPQLLSRCGRSWCNFKVKLTSIVYYHKKNCEGKLYNLFEEEYPSITKEQWVEFVRQKQEETFLKYSTEQKLRRAQLKYPAIVGCKGTAEEGIIDPPRSEEWKRSRKNKDGVYMDVPTQDLARRIDEVEMEVSQGKTKLGPQEVVSQRALGKKLQSGHVVVVGSSASVRTLFPTNKRSYNAETTRLRRIVMELRSKLADYEKKEIIHMEEMYEMNKKFSAMENELNAMKDAWLHPTSISSIFGEPNQLQGQLIGDPAGVCNSPKPFMTQDEENLGTESDSEGGFKNYRDEYYTPQKEPIPQDMQKTNIAIHPAPQTPAPNKFIRRSCLLAYEIPSNFVAFGKFESEGGEGQFIHGKPLNSDKCRVMVESIYGKNHDTPLPCPTDEFIVLSDVVHSFIAWPKNLISYDMEAINKILAANPTSSKSVIPYKRAAKPLVELRKRFTTMDLPKQGLTHIAQTDLFGAPWLEKC
ncbi:hypothetical protein ACFE04_010902 [Oxalis oulophora]